ncbi:HlyD family efflux transporter periplasmic adaptor subunit [Leifsonia shinshuensis]
MTWGNRLRLALGLLVVLVLVAAFTLIFNQRQTQATSTSATIDAESFPVGTDYGGLVTQQFVKSGARVAAGQRLFAVQSLRLQQDIASGLLNPRTAPYPVAADGTATVVAAVSGTISSIDIQQGAYAQAGTVLAHIDRRGSLFVRADFTLTAGDYSRVADGAPVDLLLPNQRVLTGRVQRIEVQTVSGRAQSTILVSGGGLVEGADDGLITPGTPVTATLHLREDGPLSGPSDAFAAFLRKIGL